MESILQFVMNVFQDTISVHRPGFYSTRFQNFFSDKVFKKIPSCKYAVGFYAL